MPLEKRNYRNPKVSILDVHMTINQQKGGEQSERIAAGLTEEGGVQAKSAASRH